MSDEKIQRAMREAILREHPDFSSVPPRVAIYRRLVRNTLSDVVFKILPRTRARMNAAHEDAFDDALAKFLESRGPRTHYLRDVPRELVEWATPRWNASDDSIAPWLVDLARHEMAWFAVATAPHVPEPRAEDVAIDKALVLSSLARIERFRFAVHEDFADDAVPAERDVALLYYRDASHALATLELTPLAAEVLARSGTPLGDAIARACESIGVAMNDEVLASVARLLADLGARGVLLGAQPVVATGNTRA
jgi:hypothetical protein